MRLISRNSNKMPLRASQHFRARNLLAAKHGALQQCSSLRVISRLSSTASAIKPAKPRPIGAAKPLPISVNGISSQQQYPNGDGFHGGAFAGALALLTIVSGGYEWYARHSDGALVPPSTRFRVGLDTLKEAAGLLPNIAEPDLLTFQSLLPPWEKRQRSPRYASGAPTVVISLEGTTCDSDYDPKVGHRLVLRPGFPELLLALGDAGAEVVLWSPRSDSSAIEGTLVSRLIDELIKRDSERFAEFCAAVDKQAKVNKALELAAAHKEGRQPRAHLLREMYFDGEKRDMFTKEILGISAVLGREHTFRSDDAKGEGIKVIVYYNVYLSLSANRSAE